MTDEVPPTDDAPNSDAVDLVAVDAPATVPASLPDSSPVAAQATVPAPLTKAEKLEAKAARLREAELARALAAPTGGGPQASSWQVAAISLIAVTAVLLVSLVVTLGFALHERSRANTATTSASAAKKAAAAIQVENLDGLRDSALKTATAVATSFGTYDYKTLTTDFARTRSYLTPSFAADFDKLTASIGTLITQDKGQTVGTVQGVGLSSITPTTAVVLVFLDQKVTTSDSTTARLDHNRLKLTLTLQKNKTWLVSQLLLI